VLASVGGFDTSQSHNLVGDPTSDELSRKEGFALGVLRFAGGSCHCLNCDRIHKAFECFEKVATSSISILDFDGFACHALDKRLSLGIYLLPILDDMVPGRSLEFLDYWFVDNSVLHRVQYLCCDSSILSALDEILQVDAIAPTFATISLFKETQRGSFTQLRYILAYLSHSSTKRHLLHYRKSKNNIHGDATSLIKELRDLEDLNTV